MVSKVVKFFLAALRWVKFDYGFLIKRSANIQIKNNIYVWGGNDPQIYLRSTSWNRLGLQGYYMLEVYTTDATLCEALLYPNFGAGFDEASTFRLELNRSGVSKRVCYFSEPATSFRWDPAEAPGELANLKIKMVKMTASFAKKMMQKKLLSLRGISDDLSIQDLSIQNLFRHYDDLFSQKVDRREQYAKWMCDVEAHGWSMPAAENFLFSIIIPVFNTPIHLLRDCIDSVIAQSYSKWELIVVDDCSTCRDVKDFLTLLGDGFSNIQVINRTENGHISKATNSGVDAANGNYICFLDHDDLLSPHALNEVATYFVSHPNSLIIYSDEDKLNEQGCRVMPYFKPDFNYELLLSHNYMSHFSVLNTKLVRSAGGLRDGYEGSQDYDLVLRCLKLSGPKLVGHIPKVLYHWRMVEGSTAFAASEKSYSSEAGLAALNDYLHTEHPCWNAQHGPVANSYKVNRNIIGSPLVSIIIPSKNQGHLLKQCVDSILQKTDYAHYEIIIIDNGSTEKDALGYMTGVSELSNVEVVIYDKPFNYSEINNFAINNYANGSYVLLMNNDVEVINNNWLNEMLQLACQDGVGCVGAKLHYPNETIQHAGVTLGIGGVAGHTHKHFLSSDFGYFSQLVLAREVSAVTAAVLLVKKSTFKCVGGLNETDLKIAFNDVDLCMKISKKGFRNVWTPFANLYHHESISRGHEDTPEKVSRFNKEVSYMQNIWGEDLKRDPFYNINLTLNYEDFSIRSL